jgi:hypothetical protein
MPTDHDREHMPRGHFQLVSTSAWGVAERFYDGREHLSDFLCLVCEVPVLVAVEVPEAMGEEQMVFQLAGRAHRDEEEAAQFGVAALSATLGYVGGYGTFSSRKSLTTTLSAYQYLLVNLKC